MLIKHEKKTNKSNCYTIIYLLLANRSADKDTLVYRCCPTLVVGFCSDTNQFSYRHRGKIQLEDMVLSLCTGYILIYYSGPNFGR